MAAGICPRGSAVMIFTVLLCVRPVQPSSSGPSTQVISVTSQGLSESSKQRRRRSIRHLLRSPLLVNAITKAVRDAMQDSTNSQHSCQTTTKPATHADPCGVEALPCPGSPCNVAPQDGQTSSVRTKRRAVSIRVRNARGNQGTRRTYGVRHLGWSRENRENQWPSSVAWPKKWWPAPPFDYTQVYDGGGEIGAKTADLFYAAPSQFSSL